jgi:hypothetical protein
MALKYAYIHPTSREYLYANSPEELLNALATFAAQTYVDHYCNGSPYTLVDVQEDGSEKWYAPDGTPVLSAADIEAKIKQMQSFQNAGVIPVMTLGT